MKADFLSDFTLKIDDNKILPHMFYLPKITNFYFFTNLIKQIKEEKCSLSFIFVHIRAFSIKIDDIPLFDLSYFMMICDTRGPITFSMELQLIFLYYKEI